MLSLAAGETDADADGVVGVDGVDVNGVVGVLVTGVVVTVVRVDVLLANWSIEG